MADLARCSSPESRSAVIGSFTPRLDVSDPSDDLQRRGGQEKSDQEEEDVEDEDEDQVEGKLYQFHSEEESFEELGMFDSDDLDAGESFVLKVVKESKTTIFVWIGQEVKLPVEFGDDPNEYYKYIRDIFFSKFELPGEVRPCCIYRIRQSVTLSTIIFTTPSVFHPASLS